MKKVFLSMFIITLFVNFSNAKEIKSSKDSNPTMSDEEFMKQWEELEQRKQKAKADIETIDEITKTLKKISPKETLDKKIKRN
jgi:N-dimethylarginine dimethylaminohydrolase